MTKQVIHAAVPAAPEGPDHLRAAAACGADGPVTLNLRAVTCKADPCQSLKTADSKRRSRQGIRYASRA